MREFTKVLCVVVLLFGAPTAAIAWAEDKLDWPRPVFYFAKYACPILCVLGVGLFLKLHSRADEVPDYLTPRVGTYFNRDGFCFGILPTVADGNCVFEVYFQNQYENPCVGRVAVRPARGFFLGRAKMDSILVEIECEAAAYGLARVAVPLPEPLQGRRQSFEVGASVAYPQGQGPQASIRRRGHPAGQLELRQRLRGRSDGGRRIDCTDRVYESGDRGDCLAERRGRRYHRPREARPS